MHDDLPDVAGITNSRPLVSTIPNVEAGGSITIFSRTQGIGIHITAIQPFGKVGTRTLHIGTEDKEIRNVKGKFVEIHRRSDRILWRSAITDPTDVIVHGKAARVSKSTINEGLVRVGTDRLKDDKQGKARTIRTFGIGKDK